MPPLVAAASSAHSAFHARTIAAEHPSRKRARTCARPVRPAASATACRDGPRSVAGWRRRPPALHVCPPTSAARDPVQRCRTSPGLPLKHGVLHFDKGTTTMNVVLLVASRLQSHPQESLRRSVCLSEEIRARSERNNIQASARRNTAPAIHGSSSSPCSVCLPCALSFPPGGR